MNSNPTTLQFARNPHGSNQLLYLDADCGPYVSYNANPGCGIGMFDGDDESDETALCLEGKYFVLNGDHREAFQKAAAEGGAKACAELYQSLRRKHSSSWSEDNDGDEWVKTWLAKRIQNVT